jgi:Zn2+/Cd2+-exporting ATPase
VAEAKRSGVAPAAVSELKNVTGRGVSGWLDGAEARLGSMAHTGELIPVCLRNHVRDVLATVQHQGRIAVVCVHDQQAAVFILSDAARPGADCLVPRLHELDVRPVVMLTGDNRLTAAQVAETLKLDEFHAELLPGDKVAQVQRLKQQARADGGSGGGSRTGVGVIGDGVNDAPALAAADVAIGIGSIGSDAALENADIVLLNDDLSAVPWAVGLARRTRRTIAINLVFALGAIVIMACAVVIGSLYGWQMPLWMGVLGHEGGTLLVVAHSLLLLVHRGVPICTCEDDGHDAPARDEGVVVTVEGRVVPSGAGAGV